MKLELIQDAAYHVIADQLEAKGLRLEDHFRVSEKGFTLSGKACKIVKILGFPGEIPESIFPVGIDRKPFTHHLSRAEGGLLNAWGTASLILSVANRWTHDGNPEAARSIIKELLSRSAPTLDSGLSLRRVRYDDRALLHLAGQIAEALTNRATQ